MDEKRIIAAFLGACNEATFCDLFAFMYPRVCRYFRLRGIDPMTAEDLAQNVLLLVFQRSGELREADLFLGWVFAIARNEFLRFWRQSRTRIETVGFDSVEMEAHHHFRIEPMFLQDARFYDWLRYLNPAERDLVALRFVEELSYEELACAFDVPLGTVKWRIFSVKKKLAGIISADVAHNQRFSIN